MNTLEILTEDQYSKLPHSSFLQSFGWGEFQASNNTIPKRYGFNDRHISVQGLEKSTPLGNYLYIPFAPNFDSSDNIQEFYNALSKNDYLFIRIEPLTPVTIPNAGVKVKNIQPAKTLILDLNKSEQDLLAEMHHKTRYNIGIASKRGVAVKECTRGNNLAELKLISETAQRQGYKAYSTDYYSRLAKFFENYSDRDRPVVRVIGAYLDDELLASGLFVDYKDTRTYLFGGTSDNNKNVMAPYALHWLAIKYAKTLGLKKYDFWGIETSSGQTPGFVRFKLGWGGQQIQYPGAYDIVIKPIWYNVYNVLRVLNSIRYKVKPIS